MVVATAPELCPNCDFFPEKEDERNFCLCSGINAYFDKMQNTSYLMSTKFEI